MLDLHQLQQQVQKKCVHRVFVHDYGIGKVYHIDNNNHLMALLNKLVEEVDILVIEVRIHMVVVVVVEEEEDKLVEEVVVDIEVVVVEEDRMLVDMVVEMGMEVVVVGKTKIKNN